MESTVVGQCEKALTFEDAQYKECLLGDFAADAIRTESGADIALLTGGLLSDDLKGIGDVTARDIENLFAEDEEIYLCELSPAELKAALEQSVSGWVLTEKEKLDADASASNLFLQFSGMTVTCDASAPVGERVLYITPDCLDEEIDLTDTKTLFKVAVTESVLEAYGLDGEETGDKISEQCIHYASETELITVDSGRLKILAAHETDLISYISPWLLVFILGIIAVNAYLMKSRTWKKT